jgi:hypothetical protein
MFLRMRHYKILIVEDWNQVLGKTKILLFNSKKNNSQINRINHCYK